MSIKWTTQVWEHSPYSGSKLLLHLAIADHANDDGICWPSISKLAKKARRSVRRAQELLNELEQEGAFERKARDGKSYIYKLLDPAEISQGCENSQGCEFPADHPAEDSHMNRHEPSFNSSSPSAAGLSACAQAWEKAGAILSDFVREDLIDHIQEMEHHRSTLPKQSPGRDIPGWQWVVDAIEEAARSNSKERISPAFLDAILLNWRQDGYKAPPPSKRQTSKTNRKKQPANTGANVNLRPGETMDEYRARVREDMRNAPPILEA